MYSPDFVDIIDIQNSNFNIWLGVRSHVHFSQEKQERMKAGKISDPILINIKTGNCCFTCFR